MTVNSGAPSRYVLITGVIAMASTLWYVAWLTVGAGSPAWAYVAMPIGAAAATCGIFSLLRTAALSRAARYFWRLLLVTFCLLALGFGRLAVEAFRNREVLPTMPVAGAGLIVAGFLTAGWAVTRVPLGIDSPGQRRRQWLDRAIAFLGCSTVLFRFGLVPLFSASEPWSTQALVLIALSFVFAVGGITKVSYIADGPVDRTAVRLIAMCGLTGAAVAFLAVTGGYESSVPAQAVVMPIAPLLAALAVRRQQLSTGAHSRQANTWLPYLATVAVNVALLSSLSGQIDWTDRAIVIAAVLVTALVAVRQYVTIRENGRLLREKRISEEQLRHEVTHDGLTGLANRELFRERLAAVLAEQAATVLIVDLDDFKTINDSLGHEIGDQLLIAVGDVLRDVAGDGGLAVRLGGDEFAILLHGDDGGETVTERVLDAFAAPLSTHHLLVHASVGIATAAPGTPLGQLLRHADVAMYAAKQRGKANVVRYHDGMEQPVLAHARIGGELIRALEAGEFRLVYQPVVNLATGRPIGAEPLLRWHHPTRGVVSPVEFIPAAEATGMIVPIGRFVLREACRQMAAWLAAFGPDVLHKIAPNVSARQLHDPDFVADVRAALDATGLSADRLILELTESATLRGTQVLRTLHELHDTGVGLSLDDFGTGESSLSLLQAFPVDAVKLDKSFVDGIELDEPGSRAAEARQAVARAVIQLAGALGLDTVAEGIENQQQAERLQTLGYTIGQGFHLARPMTAENMTLWLAVQQTPTLEMIRLVTDQATITENDRASLNPRPPALTTPADPPRPSSGMRQQVAGDATT